MKKRMLLLLASGIFLTACGRKGRTELAAEPVMVQETQYVRTEAAGMAGRAEKEMPETTGREDSCGWDEKEAYILEKIAMSEAEGEDTQGKALVIMVVLNRVRSDSFPDTVEEVVFQKNQFSPVANGRYDSVEPDSDCRAALEMVRHGWDGSQGALYFESRSDSTWHREHLKYLFRHGNHYFYTEKEGEQ